MCMATDEADDRTQIVERSSDRHNLCSVNQTFVWKKRRCFSHRISVPALSFQVLLSHVPALPVCSRIWNEKNWRVDKVSTQTQVFSTVKAVKSIAATKAGPRRRFKQMRGSAQERANCKAWSKPKSKCCVWAALCLFLSRMVPGRSRKTQVGLRAIVTSRRWT